MAQYNPIVFVDVQTFTKSHNHRFILWYESAEVRVNSHRFTVQPGHLLLVNGHPTLDLPNQGNADCIQFDERYIKNYLLAELYDLAIFYDFFKLDASQDHYLYFQLPEDDALNSILTILKKESESATSIHSVDTSLLKSHLVGHD